MGLRYLFSSIVIILFSLSADAQAVKNGSGSIDGHPSWIEQGNIYEVNIRQYTPEGTFRAFQKHLVRLKNMGVQTLWFMPINPISKKDHKGALGSYYAVADYKGINPAYGTMKDWTDLVKKAHELGFKVIIDWVPNHTGADHPWLKSHPDFYVKDKNGEALSPYDWSDTRKLNYKNQQMADSMLASMEFWIRNSGIDGYRCDVAADVPKEFWIRCIAQLHQLKNVFMLAEGDQAWLHEAGFDATYPWDAFNIMKLVAGGSRPATALDTVLAKVDAQFPANALRMYFTSNHDENSWNKADYGTMPGLSHAPFAVLTQTLKRSVPLIYSGQEEPVLDSISFFYKDAIHFGKFNRQQFYKTFLQLRKNNRALAANAPFKKLKTNNDDATFAYERNNRGDKVLVILNLSNHEQQINWVNKPSADQWENVFSGKKESVRNGFTLPQWGYKVYQIKVGIH